jgi:PHD/YefM family antitoxin component YafN of YafNO toxin-antitoxin module
MTYTLAMAAAEGIKTADDGIAEVSMTDARALLTRLIRTVREGQSAGAFTERGERRAYVVTPDFYEQALRDRMASEAAARLFADMSPEERNRLTGPLLKHMQACTRDSA